MTAGNASDRPQGPIFIIGAMGSGTTLLRLMLDSHEHIAIPPETGFMRAYKAQQYIPFKWSGRNWAKRMGWSYEELDAELSAFYEKIFTRYVTDHGKQRWGEKTPLHTWHVDDMARLYPDAQFVGIVRHPAGNAGSNIGRWSTPVKRACSHILRYDRELLRQAVVHADRFVVVRYEELVLQPEAVMRELLEWLGEPWSERVLAHHEVQADRVGKYRVEGKTKITDAVDVSRIDKWTRKLTPQQKAGIGRRLGRLGSFLGYDMEDAAVMEPLASGDSHLIRGEDLERRMERFPELDLMTKRGMSPLEDFYNPRKLRLEAIGPAAPAEATEPGASTARRAARGVARRLPPRVRRVLIAARRRD